MGWGPRGDSGPVRGRVRATQPAIFFYFPQHFLETRAAAKEGLNRALLYFCIGTRLAFQSCGVPLFLYKMLSNE